MTGFKPFVSALALACASAMYAYAAPASAPAPDPNAAEPPAGAIWLDSLDIKLTVQEYGQARSTWSVDKHHLKLKGVEYKHGVGTHAESEMQIVLDGSATRFVALAGIDDETGGKGSVRFVVMVDDKKVAETPVLHGNEEPQLVSADLTGAKNMTLLVENAGDGIDHDHADWAGAYFVLAENAATKPHTVSPGGDEPPMPIAHGTPAEPRINNPRIVGSTPGRPFIFRIPASGEGPLTFAARHLPDGLQLDANTGVISGSLTAAGTHRVKLAVTGPKGKATGVLTIVGGEHKLALTPPMGWNSWNVWGCAVDDPKIRAAADAMVSSGLAAHGFQYVNIDDCWEAKRDDKGEILTNEKFPDMRNLSDYVHSRGLRFGVYSSPGPRTCAGHEGTYQHEQQDVATWAIWGVDYIKYDWCAYGEVAKPLFAKAKEEAGNDQKRLDALNLEIYQHPYGLMRSCLDKQFVADGGVRYDRDIVFSLCQYGMGDVWVWGGEIGGNLWRTTGDINDSWSSMANIGFGHNDRSKYAGPGHWNDPDMLVVGKVGWGPKIRDTRLTPNEQITHITLWCMLSAPLLIGCDMSQLDAFTLDLLSNDEVLDVDQDPLGQAATRKSPEGQIEIWSRPLADGTTAVGLFNRSRHTAKITARWSDLGIKGKQPVRDLWQRKDVGSFKDSYTQEVYGHGAALIKIGKPK